MAKIPGYQSEESPFVRVGGGQIDSTVGGRGETILGNSISRSAQAIAGIANDQQQAKEQITAITLRQQNTIAELTARKVEQNESLEVAQKYSQLRTDWNQRLIDYQNNPTEDTLTVAQKEFDDYTKGLVEGGSSSAVKDELSLRAANFRLGFTNQAYEIQSRYQLQQFGATFDGMMSNAEDSIFATKSVTELVNQKTLMNGVIQDSINNGRIKDPSVIQNLKDKVNLLGVSWAQSVLPENPELVRAVVNGEDKFGGIMDGVSVAHKMLLLSKAEETIRTKDNQGRLLLKEALQSDKIQRIKTGEGSSLKLDAYEEAFGKDARMAAERELNNASKLHNAFELSKGATTESLLKLQEDYKPKSDPKSTTYHEENALYEDVQRIVSNAYSDKRDDAFSYFSQSPVVKPYLDKARQENASPEAISQLQEVVLEQQKLDKGMDPFDYRVMPKADAEQFISQFNKLIEIGSKTDGPGVRDVLVNFSQKYKDHLPIALNQLAQTQGGDKITPKINPLLWHVNNESTFRLIVDAIRKDQSEQYARFSSDKQKKNFLADVSTDKNLLNYKASIFAANNGKEASQLVGGVHDTFRDFARDYVLNGGKLNEASSVFFSTYSWGNHNGVPFARPLQYVDNLGVAHQMNPEQVAVSDFRIKAYTRLLSASSVDPETIVNATQGFTTEQLEGDVRNALDNNTFWSTTEDESGLYLFTKGTMSGAPRQVFLKTGKPVRLNFNETLTPIPYGEVDSSAYPAPM